MINPQKAIDMALEIAENLPEKYQVAAFQELLKYALTDSLAKSVSQSTDKETRESKSASHTDIPDSLANVYNNLPEGHIVAAGSKKQQALWAVIELSRKGEIATTNSVRELIKTLLGVTPENTPNTSSALRDLTPRHLIREKQGKGYIYFPTKYAEEIFEDLE